MAYSQKAYEAAKKYKSAKIKRIPLDIQKEEYEIIRKAAEERGEKVNEFIKKAIRQRLERESLGEDKTTDNTGEN